MPNYHSEVIGSLLRPEYLKAARQVHEAGGMSQVEFKRIEDRAVNDAIALQTEVGLDVITDGEMRRFAFYGHFIDSVEGYDKLGGWGIPFRDEKGEQIVLKRPVVVSKLKRIRPMCTEEFTYMRARRRRPTMTPRSPEAHTQTSMRIWQMWSICCAWRWKSWCISAATTSSLTRRNTPVCSIPRFVRVIASAAWTRTSCSTAASNSTTP
jgi:hypothetical protein